MPSTNELAAYYRINPATAAKGIGMLTDDGLVEKRRGVGMFVAAGPGRGCSVNAASGSPNGTWSRWSPRPLLGIDADELVAMIRQSSYAQKGTRP